MKHIQWFIEVVNLSTDRHHQNSCQNINQWMSEDGLLIKHVFNSNAQTLDRGDWEHTNHWTNGNVHQYIALAESWSNTKNEDQRDHNYNSGKCNEHCLRERERNIISVCEEPIKITIRSLQRAGSRYPWAHKIFLFLVRRLGGPFLLIPPAALKNLLHNIFKRHGKQCWWNFITFSSSSSSSSMNDSF